jgi:CBS domain containing-hemolysin-like protein
MIPFILGITLILIFSDRAYAYIDPNAGGFFFTSILPFVYGILAAIVIFWKRIAQAVKSLFSGKKEEGDT